MRETSAGATGATSARRGTAGAGDDDEGTAEFVDRGARDGGADAREVAAARCFAAGTIAVGVDRPRELHGPVLRAARIMRAPVKVQVGGAGVLVAGVGAHLQHVQRVGQRDRRGTFQQLRTSPTGIAGAPKGSRSETKSYSTAWPLSISNLGRGVAVLSLTVDTV